MPLVEVATPELFPVASVLTSPPAPVPAAVTTAVAPETPDPASHFPDPIRGQLLLGTDKRNPLINVYEDDTGERLLVYYGFEIIEIVPQDRAAPAFKLMLGRFYNAGLKLSTLCATFAVDPKTIRRWGRVLLQKNPVELIRVLEGRSATRKRTLAVESFARLRWPHLVAERSYGASKRLQQEIHRVFGVAISRSGLQSFIQELKAGGTLAPAPAPTTAEDSPLSSSDSGTCLAAATGAEISPEAESQKRESGVQCLAAGFGDTLAQAPENQGFQATPPPAPPENRAHSSPFFPRDPADSLYWCDHAGVLIFATALASVSQVSATPQGILAQWLAALWLGAQNIEQTKFLNWEDLELILGGVVRYPTPQRDQLKGLATDAALVAGLWRFNQANLGVSVGTDFYFDPHTKHYTGEQNVLKGWCSKIRFADKILHSDFIHTAQGQPIYFETEDNFADLRQRFGGVIARARQALQWPADRVPSYVLDRGIFGQKFFESVIGNPSFHLITWQKGFVAQPWDSQKVMGKTTLTRYRNSSQDVRTYHFEYVDQLWDQNTQLRQLVVQATDYKGRTIQVAILTDDPKRPASEIIQLMFQRWLQENDFKYLDKHFGINQITSYRSVEYAKLKGQVVDRELKSAARKALELSQRQVTEQLKRHLLAEEQAQQAQQRRAVKRQQLEQQRVPASSSDTAARQALNRNLAALKSADQRHEITRVERRKRIGENQQQSADIQVQIAGTQARESRLEALIQAQMVKLDGHCKRLMDVLKITARNLFYQALQPFQQAYDNYRDDHDHFRQLTQSPGVLEVRATEIVIHLLPRTNYGGELRKVVIQTLEGINAKGLEHPCLPGRKLKFRLGQRSEMEVRMNVSA